MQSAKKRTHIVRLLAVALSAAFFISLLPVLAAARYDAPDSDDLLYGQEAQAAFEESGSVGALLQAAGQKVRHHHQVAHGRFANTFFGAAYLGAVGLSHYELTPVLMLLALIAGTLALTYAALCRVLGMRRDAWLALSMLMLLLQVQLMPSPAEGLFWFCGGLGYTLYYAGTLLLLALLILCDRAGRRGARIACGALAVLTAGIVSGLGFTLMIATGALVTGYVVRAAVQKRRAALGWGAAALAVLLAGCIVQLTAPAVAVRAEWEQAMYGYEPMGAASAILQSFAYAAGTLLYRLDAGMLLFLALSCVLSVAALQRSAYAFRLPALVTLGSFCLYATLFTASLYATSTMGPYRQRNIIYFTEFFFWGGNAVYWTGWFVQKWRKSPDYPAQSARVYACAARIATHRLALLTGVFLLLAAAVLNRGLENATSVAALRELASGSARARHEIRMVEIAAGRGDTPGEREASRLYLY